MSKILSQGDLARIGDQYNQSEIERFRKSYVAAMSAYGAARRIYPAEHPELHRLMLDALHAKYAYYAAKVVWHS